MRPARSRRVQAQRKFAQGAYVPPNVPAVVATDTRRETTQDARNVTINHVPATGLLDVVSLQNAVSTSDRSGLTSQPVVLLERLRGRHLTREVPPSPQPGTSQPQHLKSTITRKKQDCKSVHPMSLRSRRLSKLELNKIIAQNSVLKRKKPLKRKIDSSDEDDEPLIFQKTRKKCSTSAISKSNSVSKAKSTKNFEVPRKNITKVLKTSLVKQNSTQKKNPVKSPQKRTRNECITKKPAEISVPIVTKKKLTGQRDLVSKAALDNLVSHDSVVAGDPNDSLAPDNTLASNSSLAPEDPEIPDDPYAPVDPEIPDDPFAPVDPANRPYGIEIEVMKHEFIIPDDCSDQSEPPMYEEEFARMDEALAVLKDSDPNKGSANRSDDETAAQSAAPVEEATDAAVPLRKDMADQYRISESPEDFPSLVYGSDASNDEPMLLVRNVQHKAVQLPQSSKIDQNENRRAYPSVKKLASREQLREKMIAEIEADRRMVDEVDTMAKTLDQEKDAKSMHPRQGTSSDEEPGTSESSTEGGTLKDAPVYYPTTEEFQDPITFYEKIFPEIFKYGVCKVVPPPGWTPPSEVHGDIRFDVMNQYISRLFSRWGPAARELSAIKMCLHHQNINFTRAPRLDGVEINLSKLYHLVQRLGGLETVINKKRWGKVADDMKLRGGNYERRLEQIYMKNLLPYDTLSHQERQEIMHRVEIAWNKKNQKLLDRAMNPLYRQKRMLGLMDSSDDEAEEEETMFALKTAEDCILKGHLMQHSRFQKVAAITYENTFGQGSEAAGPPLQQIEEQYWRLVTSGTEHACVHTAAIDTGAEGHGFTTKVEPYASHPWNPKKVIENPRNVLRYLGPVVGVTLPTLLLGMLFSTSCWHKDPHGVAWYEYQSVGPTRIWYGIPADQADNFRKAVETLSPTSCQNKALWLSSEITMIPPSVLREHNVSLSRVTQDEREFILAVPNAYSCCISTGYTQSESVYFAPPSWLDCLWQVFKEARESCEPTMFSMEHLLYNIGSDTEPVLDILKRAQPLYDRMLREEVTNRQMLQERGLPFVQELLSVREPEQSNSTYRARPLEECDYCRASLFLSKVKGLPAKNSVLCLEHTLMLLDTDKYKDTDVGQLQMLVHVSVKELHKVRDNMERHLRNI